MGGNEALGRELERLLSEPRCVQRWAPYVQRRRHPGVHQGAVAQVLAAHLWSTGEAPDTDTELPRRLKDRVSRALSGRGTSEQGLRLFIDAFGIGRADAARLHAIHAGSAPGRLLSLGGSTGGAPRTQDYETIALHEVHTIGADGLPQQHQITQVIRALRPLTSYEYRIDTNAAAVEIVRGGRPGPVVDSGLPGLYSCHIELTSPVPTGGTASLEYRTFFAYEVAPPREFRRGVRLPARNVALDLVFHPDAVPAVVEWCRWDLPGDAEPTDVEAVELGSDHTAHRFVDVMAAELRGYRWR